MKISLASRAHAAGGGRAEEARSSVDCALDFVAR
jgi:hypothetical protein